MDNNENFGNDTDKVNWDDDSGEIHTVSHTTVQTPEDGWQEVHRLNGKVTDTPHFVKGKQVHYTYTTDDYRKVIPALIISTIIIAAFCVGAWFISPIIGVLITIFGVVWIVGSWKQAPKTKWKNQAQKLKEERERQNTDGTEKK